MSEKKYLEICEWMRSHGACDFRCKDNRKADRREGSRQEMFCQVAGND